MHKRQLQYFLKSCYLGGEISSLVWKYNSKSKELFTRFITGSKNMLGELSCNSLYDFSNDTETELELDWNEGKDFKIGIYDLEQFVKMISILDDTELKIELDMYKDRAVRMEINDGCSVMEYMCSDLSVINQPPTLKRIPNFKTLIFPLTESTKKFGSATKVFEKDIAFKVMKNTKPKNKGFDEIIFSVGHSPNLNTNRYDVCFGSPMVGLDDGDQYYNAKMLSRVFEILDMFGVVSTIRISNEGIAHISNNRKFAKTNETKYGIRYDYYLVEAMTP